MEIILAAIAGAALGIFFGYIVAHSKSKYLLIEVERLKWQLDN